MVIIAEPQVALVQAAGAAGLVGVAGAAGLAGAGAADVCVMAELPQPLKAIIKTQVAAGKHRRMITQGLFVRCGWRIGLSFLVLRCCRRVCSPGAGWLLFEQSAAMPWMRRVHCAIFCGVAPAVLFGLAGVI
jgi:hypothetical protein